MKTILISLFLIWAISSVLCGLFILSQAFISRLTARGLKEEKDDSRKREENLFAAVGESVEGWPLTVLQLRRFDVLLTYLETYHRLQQVIYLLAKQRRLIENEQRTMALSLWEKWQRKRKLRAIAKKESLALARLGEVERNYTEQMRLSGYFFSIPQNLPLGCELPLPPKLTSDRANRHPRF
jgi:hypothetical protein